MKISEVDEGTMSDKVYILILNWNGWQDTVACLESVFGNDYNPYVVVVCDNGSTDDSWQQLQAWAQGKTSGKLITYITYSRKEAEAGGIDGREAPLILIQTGENLGFAGGNNVGLRYVLRRNNFAYVWLLNNDTVIDKHALTAMVERMSPFSDGGLCGSTLRYYYQEDYIQAYGGFTYNYWFGISHQIGQWHHVSQPVPTVVVEETMFGIQGASMLISQSFLKNVGLLSEDYFLYFEEQDWAVRARRKGYRLLYAADSIVYHKEGQSSGANDRCKEGKSWLADQYMVRNRIRFTRKFYPWALPTVYLAFIGTLVNRMRRRQWDRVWKIVAILLRGGA